MTTIEPAILPEDKVPAWAHSCRRCELHQHGGRVIWGEGNPQAPIFVILDNPGARENKKGQPFLCGTRETLQTAASEAGLRPNSLYVTYLLKCRPRRAYDKAKARWICIEYLWDQLESARPKLIFCLGNVACQALFENEAAAVKNLRGQVHRVKAYSVIVSYHPLAVRRRPTLSQHFLRDWKFLASQL